MVCQCLQGVEAELQGLSFPKLELGNEGLKLVVFTEKCRC